MTGILLGILTFLVVLYFDVQSDYKRLTTNTIDHKRGALVRTLALLPSFGCFYFPLDNLGWLYIFAKFIVVTGLLVSWWWEFFDGWLNTKRGKSWRYNGSDDKDDAKTDNFLQKLTPIEQMAVKWGLIITFTTLYILL